ncbi:unnamed protein product [Ambrosiozyma monospora]|uniref:Unnamed protein product n=1 Tax=Ambrosiozyma monospora TaxID=43982 RepID=A0A9W6YW20_AMBMO|nr:unnamed protein product [Ambrosiozyma monospora]
MQVINVAYMYYGYSRFENFLQLLEDFILTMVVVKFKFILSMSLWVITDLILFNNGTILREDGCSWLLIPASTYNPYTELYPWNFLLGIKV